MKSRVMGTDQAGLGWSLMAGYAKMKEEVKWNSFICSIKIITVIPILMNSLVLLSFKNSTANGEGSLNSWCKRADVWVIEDQQKVCWWVSILPIGNLWQTFRLQKHVNLFNASVYWHLCLWSFWKTRFRIFVKDPIKMRQTWGSCLVYTVIRFFTGIDSTIRTLKYFFCNARNDRNIKG